MKELFDPIKSESLKDVFIARFEELILSGKLSIGQKLPSERELAMQLGVSRPVVHEGLVDLAFKGLVSMKPRVGTVVNDFRKEGSLALLTSLLNYHDGRIEPNLLDSILGMRKLVELETARLAACNRSGEQLEAFFDLLGREEAVAADDAKEVAALDFAFHHGVAMATGNMIYPLLLNSFRELTVNLTSLFFTDAAVVPVVFGFHRALVEAIEARDAGKAVEIMKRILEHGEERLKGAIAEA